MTLKRKRRSNPSDLDDQESDDHHVNQKWFEVCELPSVSSNDIKDVDSVVLKTLRKEAGTLFNNEVCDGIQKVPKTIPKSDYTWIKTVLQKGTVGDKIAANILLIQDNPIGNVGLLRNLVGMVKISKKKECFLAMENLPELFLEYLLPTDRKLKLFAMQPLAELDKLSKNKKELREKYLLYWFFEEQLKEIYASFVKVLNEAAHDSVDANKEKVITIMHKLLAGHPEQEAVLLSYIVNKLGDPSHKIGSKVIYTLTKLLDTHPNMKGVVMQEVERVIFRPNISKRAQYYSICFLTQFTFDHSDGALAADLISIYFAMFKACIKTGEIDSRLMSALLTGVSRAYPYAKKENLPLTEHVSRVFKIAHLGTPNVTVHALSLLFLVAGDDPNSFSRFMSVLYKKVGDLQIYKTSHHAMFISLIFKALKKDSENGRVLAFIKRIFQVSVYLSVPVVCGLLYLVSQIIYTKENFTLTMQQNNPINIIQEDDEDDEEKYVDTEELKPINEENKEKTISSWHHRSNLKHKSVEKSSYYDPYQRNPLYAGGEQAFPAELTYLSRHFHPTVSLFANNILNGERINYTGDPLQDFTLIRFLDKFVFKNPKIPKEDYPVSTFAKFGRKKYYAAVGVKRLRTNTKEYLNSAESAIPVDETYIYNYMKSQKPRAKEEDEESDIESVDSDEFDEIMSKMQPRDVYDEDLDFLNEAGDLSKKQKKTQKAKDDVESGEDEMDDELDEEDIDDEEDFDDDGGDIDDEEDFDDDDGDDGDDDDNNYDDGDDFLSEEKPKRKDRTGKKSGLEGLFASAEEFSHYLDDDNYNAGTSTAVSNKDNATVKQLKWEEKRDQWVKGRRFKKKKVKITKPIKSNKRKKK